MSGGQRLAIARALVRDPHLLILDEATSALDAQTEAEIMGTLERVSHDRTTISITHRLSMAVPADHIFVLADARVVEEETHATRYAAHSLHRCLYDEHTVTVATVYQ